MPMMRPVTSGLRSVGEPVRPPRSEWARQMWRQFRRNRLSLTGGAIVLCLVVVALAGPHLGLPSPVRLNISQRFLPPGRGTGSGRTSSAGMS